jgi:hypothetical protein
MHLFKMIDFGEMFCWMGELKLDTFAVPARRKSPALYSGHLMRHVDVYRIVGDSVMPDCGTISPGLYSCAMVFSKANSLMVCQTECNQAAFRRRRNQKRPAARNCLRLSLIRLSQADRRGNAQFRARWRIAEPASGKRGSLTKFDVSESRRVNGHRCRRG